MLTAFGIQHDEDITFEQFLEVMSQAATSTLENKIRGKIKGINSTFANQFYSALPECLHKQQYLGSYILVLQTAHSRVNARVVYFIVVESTSGYTFTPCVGYFTSPGIKPDRRDRRLLVPPPKDTGKAG